MGKKMTAYAATGNLGYGFPEISLQKGLEQDPAFLASDAGSCDPGPNYLGMGKAFVSRTAAKRDMRLLMKAAAEKSIPLIIGSCGGGGSDDGVKWMLEITREIMQEEGLSFKIATISSELSHEYLRGKLAEGKIAPLDGAAELTLEEIDLSVHTVAAMGPEPIQAALKMGADLILAGRATDASLYAAIPLMEGFDAGLVWHAAKIIECGAAMAVPKSSDSMLAHIYEDRFVLEPPNPAKNVKAINVAAHTMYECPHPNRIHEPPGIIDSSCCTFTQLDEHTVEVRGSKFEQAPYSVKLESVKSIGYRAISIGGTHDPTLISIVDQHLENIKRALDERVGNLYPDMRPGGYDIHFHVYGKNGVMEDMELSGGLSHELGFVIDVISTDQQRANAIVAAARTLLMHLDYPGRKCIAGSIAFPFSPSDIPVGEVFSFNMNHVIMLDDPMEPFAITRVNF